MVRNARTAWRWLDLVPAFRRLIVVCVLGFSFHAVPASATTWQQAKQTCDAALVSLNLGGNCDTISADSSGHQRYEERAYNAAVPPVLILYGYYYFEGDGPPPSNPCSSLTSTTGMFGGPLAEGWSSTIPVTDPASGALVRCTVVYHVISPCVYTLRYGWQCYGTLTPTGNPANDGDNSGSPGDWSDAGGGKPAVPPPAPPSPLPPNNTNPPKECGGGSCYDPGSDNYCAVAGGQQVCVSGPSGRSPSGGCAYGGGGAVCAGAPSAPSPSPGNIQDPPTDIRSTDKTTQADPNTGAPIQVTTNVYAPPSVTTNSGQTSSDTGPSGGGQPTTGNEPAHSSSTSGGGSYAGGGDCSSPPICTGDAATCGAARQQWYAMCSAHADSQQLHKDLTGDGSTPSIPAGPSKSDVWTDGTSTGDSTGDSANQGSYDTTGFGFNTQCPMTDLTVPLWDGKSFTFAMSKGCVVGPWLHGIIIAFALFAAAKITAGAS